MHAQIFVRALAAVVLSSLAVACSNNSTSATGPMPALRLDQAAEAGPAWTQVSVGTFVDPYSVTLNPSCSEPCDIYVADPGSNNIYEIKPDGATRPILDPNSVGPTFDPVGISMTKDGTLYVADKGSSESTILATGAHGGLREISAGRESWPLFNRSVAGYYNFGGTLRYAVYAAVASHLPLTSAGRVACVQGGPGCLFSKSTFSDPYGVAVDDSNQVFMVDARDKKAYRISAGPQAHDLGMTFVDPYGIAVTPDGRWVYVADAGAKKVYERSPDGTWSVIGTFADPYGVAVGADRTVYVADPGSKQVWKLRP
jgi:DNA-binding beta-propeller fold protein YncE